MTTRRSAKNKGMKFQKEIASILLDRYSKISKLEARDIVSQPSSVPGIDIILSNYAQKVIPFDIECKNQQNTSIWSWLKQCEENAREDRVPLLIFKRNREDTYVCLKLKDLLKIDIGD